MRYVDEIFDRMHCVQLNTFSYREFAWFKKIANTGEFIRSHFISL